MARALHIAVRRNRLIIAAVLLLAAACHKEQPETVAARPKPEAPPDLQKLRATFTAGLDALNDKKGADAAAKLASFTFGKRAVEEYRLWLLGQSLQLAKNAPQARVTLAQLWVRDPKGVYRDDAGFALTSLYAEAGDYHHAFDTAAVLASDSTSSDNAARARMTAMESAMAMGDVSAVLFAARNVAIKNPAAAPAGDAVTVVQSLTSLAADRPIKLTPRERLERAVSFLRDGDGQNCLDEITFMEELGVPSDLRLPVQLNKGLALQQLRRLEESNKVLEPLTGGPYRVSIPALYFAARNYRTLSASINPLVNKVITVRQKVKVKKKTVTRKVKKTVQLVDLAKKAKKESYDALYVRRLKDLLPLPLADDVRIQVLTALIAAAETKNQDD